MYYKVEEEKGRGAGRGVAGRGGGRDKNLGMCGLAAAFTIGDKFLVVVVHSSIKRN